MNKKRYLSIAVVVMMLCLVACGGDKKDKESKTETTTLESTTEQTEATTVEKTTKESTTVETTEITTEETTTVEETETTTEVTTEPETTTIAETTTLADKETTTKKKQQTTKKPQQTTAKKEEETTEFIEDGYHIWRYASDIYANDPVKSEMEAIFWSEFGWTTFSKEKNDAMVKAMVELVYGIMQTYKTDFERERALYEAICLTCRYDYDSLETGLTSAGQTPYGVLIERKAVCGGYACTFHLGLTMMGIENRLITGSTTEGLHAWNQVCLDGEWYQVDVTWGDDNCDQCPSGTCDCTFGYDYFNRTSEWMSTTHEVRGEDCTGTKYNEDYLVAIYTPEYLEGKVYIETVEECMKYINSQLESGNSTVNLYAPTEVWSEVADIIWDYEVWNESYPPSEVVTKNNYQYTFFCERGQRYKNVRMEHVGEINIEVFSVDKFRESGNFFENVDDLRLYVDEQLRNGSQEVIAYFNFLPGFSLDLEILNQGGYISHYTPAYTEYRSFKSIEMLRIVPYVEE